MEENKKRKVAYETVILHRIVLTGIIQYLSLFLDAIASHAGRKTVSQSYTKLN